MSGWDVVLGSSGFDAGKGTQVAVLFGATTLILAAIIWLWGRFEQDGARGRGAEVSIEDRVNVVEAQRRLTRWAARLAGIGGACWASAVVLFMVWLSE